MYGNAKKERKALYLLEMQSVGMISLAAGIFMSVIHFIACLLRMEKQGKLINGILQSIGWLPA